jgi:protein TonB
MKLIILCLFISISLHLLLFNNYELTKKLDENKKALIKEKKSNVTFVKIKKEKKIIKEVQVKKTESIKKQENKKIKKIKKVTRIKKDKKSIKKKPITKKVSKKLVKAPKKISFQKKRVIKKTTKTPTKKKMQTLQNKTLEDFLSQKEPINQKVLNQIEKLYGREFETFTKVQKAFIKKNLNNFQQVTQRVLTRLGYPHLAAKLKISGINIVEFVFHANGNISNLRITNSSGYEILDKYTIKLIEIAYKDYPKPKTSTKLKFNVQYRIY